jgi:hypothetical protein
VAFFTLSRLAAAQSTTPRPATLLLSWAPAPGCIDGPALGALIERTLDRKALADASSADARLDGTITARGRVFAVHLEVRRLTGDGAPLASRDLEIEADDCRALDGSIAVVAALLADGTSALPETPPPPPAKLHVKMPKSPRHAGALLGVGGGVTFGLLPRPASFASASAWIAPIGPFRVGFEGRVWLPQTELVGGTGAQVSAFVLGGSACWRPLHARVTIGACARFDAGAMTDSPINLSVSTSAERALIAVGLDARVGITIAGPLYVEVSADLGVPLVRPRFYYTDLSGTTVDLNQVFPITASIGLVIGARFGE